MSEKVLGFKKKNCVEYSGYYSPKLSWTVHEEDLVPVVSVEWLEDWCEGNQFGFKSPRVNVDELLLAVHRQSSKERGEKVKSGGKRMRKARFGGFKAKPKEAKKKNDRNV